MLKGRVIFAIGVLLFAVGKLISHIVDFAPIAFFIGAGCALSLVGIGKIAFDNRAKKME